MKELGIQSLEPKAEAPIVLSAPADMTALCENYGELLPSVLPDPSSSNVSGKALEIAAVGEKSTVILEVRVGYVKSRSLWIASLCLR